MDERIFENKSSCVFTGHRPDRLPDLGDESAPGMMDLKLNLIHAVEDAIKAGVTDFYAGGAPGFDTIAAEATLALAPLYPGVRLHLALPSKTQSASFDAALKARYERILIGADSVYYASENDNSAISMHMRNRYMVDRADVCIAYLASSAGGTFMTVSYARKKGLPILNLYGDASC